MIIISRTPTIALLLVAMPLVKCYGWCSFGEISCDLTMKRTNILFVLKKRNTFIYINLYSLSKAIILMQHNKKHVHL